VGRTADGRQFFITDAFVPASPTQAGREFMACYCFDAQGRLLDAQIEDFGPRPTDEAARQAWLDARLAELAQPGELRFGRIAIAPFAITRFGVEFGLIPNWPEDDDEDLSISLMPGDFMCFWAPWDSGEYDT
jgi:hypothetical protein